MFKNQYMFQQSQKKRGEQLKLTKLAYGILAAGIFILVFCNVLGESIVSKLVEINGPYNTDKISAHVLNNQVHTGNASFSLDDMRRLEKLALKDKDMAYSTETKAAVSYEGRKTDANVIGVSDKCNMFHGIILKSGSFINGGNKEEMVAVVDENFALALFNNLNVTGMYIELYNRKYKIIGVAGVDESVVETLTQSGLGTVYIPVGHMLQAKEDLKINSLQVRTSNQEDLNNALRSIGKSPSNYRITDYGIEKKLVEQKTKLGIFLMGIGAVIVILRFIKRKIWDIFMVLKSGLKENYFLDVLKQNSVRIGLMVLEMLLAMISVFIIWKMVRFNLYIPPENIPGELIDTEFYRNLFNRIIQSRVQNSGNPLSSQEMDIKVLGAMQNWNFCIFLLGGLPLFFLGLYLLKQTEAEAIRIEIICGVILAVSMIMSLLILSMLNMPFAIYYGQMLIVFVFIFLVAEMAGGHRNKVSLEE